MASSREMSSLYLKTTKVEKEEGEKRVRKQAGRKVRRRGEKKDRDELGGGKWTEGSPLLQESLRVDHVLSDGGGFPSPEGSGRVDLVERRTSMRVPAGDEEGDSEGSDTTARDERERQGELTRRRKVGECGDGGRMRVKGDGKGEGDEQVASSSFLPSLLPSSSSHLGPPLVQAPPTMVPALPLTAQ